MTSEEFMELAKAAFDGFCEGLTEALITGDGGKSGMEDVIKRSDAVNAIKKEYRIEISEYGGGRNTGLFVAQSVIEKLPSAGQVQQVIKCRECKYFSSFNAVKQKIENLPSEEPEQKTKQEEFEAPTAFENIKKISERISENIAMSLASISDMGEQYIKLSDIEELEKYRPDCRFGGYPVEYVCLDSIRKLQKYGKPSENSKSPWIPCSKRLPNRDEYGEVLITFAPEEFDPTVLQATYDDAMGTHEPCFHIGEFTRKKKK